MLEFQALGRKDSRIWAGGRRLLRTARHAKCLIGNAGRAAGRLGLCPGAPPPRPAV